jgi:hypothetical protein
MKYKFTVLMSTQAIPMISSLTFDSEESAREAMDKFVEIVIYNLGNGKVKHAYVHLA